MNIGTSACTHLYTYQYTMCISLGGGGTLWSSASKSTKEQSRYMHISATGTSACIRVYMSIYYIHIYILYIHIYILYIAGWREHPAVISIEIRKGAEQAHRHPNRLSSAAYTYIHISYTYIRAYTYMLVYTNRPTYIRAYTYIYYMNIVGGAPCGRQRRNPRRSRADSPPPLPEAVHPPHAVSAHQERVIIDFDEMDSQ